tara:strand:+ start:516 stop:1442 length:927 start_codon:yes stop_codon:yes gene_type:complete
MFLNKIIAVGDLHGDFQVFIKVLEMCNLINKNLNWIGGDTYLIQLGDTLDGKRPGVNIEKEFLEESGEIEIINFILNLDSQAKQFGGRVISLIGNHELYPYYFKNNKQIISDYVKKKDIDQFKRVYNSDRIKFLMPGGIGGSLLGRTRPLILQLGEFIFVHGSITDKLIKHSLKNGKVDINKINMETSLWLQGKGKIPKYLDKMDEENPIFSRLYSEHKIFNKKECDKIDKQLKFFNGANYVVMGHSIFDEINSTCSNKLLRTDVALSRAFGGTLFSKNLQALEIIQNKFGDVPEINIISKNGKIKLS